MLEGDLNLEALAREIVELTGSGELKWRRFESRIEGLEPQWRFRGWDYSAFFYEGLISLHTSAYSEMWLSINTHGGPREEWRGVRLSSAGDMPESDWFLLQSKNDVYGEILTAILAAGYEDHPKS